MHSLLAATGFFSLKGGDRIENYRSWLGQQRSCLSHSSACLGFGCDCVDRSAHWSKLEQVERGGGGSLSRTAVRTFSSGFFFSKREMELCCKVSSPTPYGSTEVFRAHCPWALLDRGYLKKNSKDPREPAPVGLQPESGDRAEA